MALIICPECKKEISDKSEQCIHCGFPLEKLENEKVSESHSKPVNICLCCGNTLINSTICPDCGSQMVSCNCNEDELVDMIIDGSYYEWKFRMREKHVINSEFFNPELYNKRIAEEKKEKEFHERFRGGQEPKKVKVVCQYCGSTNVEKISLMSKAVHNTLFGIWSLGRNTKEFHCNNCGADF